MTSIDDTADFMNQFNKAAEEQEQESDYDVNNGNGKFKVAEAKKKTKVQLKSKSEQVQREEKEHEERIAAIAKSVSSFEEWQTKLVEKYQTLYNVVQKNLPNLWHSLEFDLSSALKEREWIREFAETKGLDFYVNSTYQDVIKTLETGGIDLLHFSTHSRFHEMPNLSSIVLENEIEFRPQQIIGKTTKFGQTNPVVIKYVLNKISDLLSNKKTFLKIAIISVIESMRNDPEKYSTLVYHNNDNQRSSTRSKDNGNLLDASRQAVILPPPPYDNYMIEYYKDIMLEEAEKLYNDIVDQILCEVVNENVAKQPAETMPSSLPALPLEEG